jgi:hypothetical protein
MTLLLLGKDVRHKTSAFHEEAAAIMMMMMTTHKLENKYSSKNPERQDSGKPFENRVSKYYRNSRTHSYGSSFLDP